MSLLPQVSSHGEPLHPLWSSLPFSWENMKQKHMFLKSFVHLSETMSHLCFFCQTAPNVLLSSSVTLVPAESQLPVFDGTLTHQYGRGCSPQVISTFAWFQGQTFLEKLQQSLWYLILDMLSLPWVLRRGLLTWILSSFREQEATVDPSCSPNPASSHHMLFILLYLLHFANKERTLVVLHPYLNHSHLDLASQVFGWVTGDQGPGKHYKA